MLFGASPYFEQVLESWYKLWSQKGAGMKGQTVALERPPTVARILSAGSCGSALTPQLELDDDEADFVGISRGGTSTPTDPNDEERGEMEALQSSMSSGSALILVSPLAPTWAESSAAARQTVAQSGLKVVSDRTRAHTLA